MASPISDVNVGPLYWFNFALVLLVGLVSWLLRRLIRTLDNLQTEVAKLQQQVAYILGSDRRKRLRDYGCPLEDDGPDFGGGLS